MSETASKSQPTLPTLHVPPGSWARWPILFAAWALFIASLPLDTANCFRLALWSGELNGWRFLRFVLFELPIWYGRHALRRNWGYLPPMELMWLVCAVAATLLLLASPLIFLRLRRPATLLTLRYLALVLLVFPITVFLPEGLEYPQPRIGLYLIAAAHALVLVGLWSPWPLLKQSGKSFEVEMNACGKS